MSFCQVLPLPFESRLRGFLGRGRYSFALDYPLAVLEVEWAGRLVRGGTWSLRRGLQRSLVRGRWYHSGVKPCWWYSYCGSGVYLWYSFMLFLSTGSRSVFDGCGHLSQYLKWTGLLEYERRYVFLLVRCSWRVRVAGTSHDERIRSDFVASGVLHR